MINIQKIIFMVRNIVKNIMEKATKILVVNAGRISTTELVDKIYNFCEVYSGKVMYAYQAQFSKRIIRSVLENDGVELTALFSRQSGKCFAKDTEILMYDGRREKVQDIREGDLIMTPNSSFAKVVSLGRGTEEMYEVKPLEKNHESFVVNKSHILSLMGENNEIKNISVEDYLKLPEWERKKYRGYRVGVEYKHKSVPLDPYLLGINIGLVNIKPDEERRIPKCYLINNRRKRLKLLAGLIDSNVCVESNEDGNILTFNNKELAKDVLVLIRSLGYKSNIAEKIVEDNKVIYNVKSYGDFSYILNVEDIESKEGGIVKFDFELIPKGVGEYYGFTLDSKDRLFLLGDYTVTHNTETVAITVGGLMIILPQLANMPMFLEDPRFRMFRDGFQVGIFAPSQRQAQITYGRMKSRLQCKEALVVLEDPDFNLVFTTSNGQTVALSNGSFCTAISASDGSSIEGESFKFIICEECFVKGTPILTECGYKCIESVSESDKVYSYNHALNKVELKRVQRSFKQPLYNRKLVKIKTNTGKEIVCTDNHRIFKANTNSYVRADSLQVHDLMLLKNSLHKRVLQEEIVSIEVIEVSEVDVYDLTVEDNHNFFANGLLVHNCQDISNFKIRKCLTGDTEVLTSTGEYKRLDEIVKGKNDLLYCLGDNFKTFMYKKPFEFYDNGVQDVYKVTLENGYNVKCTLNHKFPSYYRGEKSRFKDRTLKDIIDILRNNPTFIKLAMVTVLLKIDTGEHFEDSPKSLSFFNVKSIEYVGREHTYCVNMDKNEKGIHNIVVNGGISTSQSIHPMGAAYNATICKIGTATTFKGDFYEAINRNKEDFKKKKTGIRNHFEYDYKVVQRYNPKYAKYIEREKRSLGETSDEFQMSYCLRWVISRGMFVDINKFEAECGDNYLDRVYQDHMATHVVGIDIGGGSSKNRKKADSTVITVVEVDWENPVLMESTIDDETGEPIVYMAYNTYIKDWYEIAPEIAENYEEQYHLIMDYLKNFKVARLVIDATREASLGQRIMANVNYDVVLFTFSSKSKSDIYKHLQTEINTGRARFPNNPKTRDTKEYKKYLAQMGDLQKSYSGSYLVVSHPDSRTAHDDYSDSWALAVWGTKDVGQVDNTETQNRDSVLRSHRETSMLFRSRNHYTARRR